MSLDVLKENPQYVDEIKAVIDSGDVSLTERRTVFAKMAGRTTKLTDDQLIRAIAATNDDDDELFMQNVIEVETEIDG